MLSLAKLGRGSEGYYLDAVAKGAEDYYVGRGEAPGSWTGRGTELRHAGARVRPAARSADRACASCWNSRQWSVIHEALESLACPLAGHAELRTDGAP